MKKKFSSFIFAICLILPCVFALTACGASYQHLQIEYTPDLEFLVGEDYEDEQIKALATLSDGSIEDVTHKITIDTSEYNKNAIGKYKIYFKFEDLEDSCEVSVVDKIVATSTINSRFAKVINTSFGTGAYSFEMSSTGTYNSVPFTQIIKHSVTSTGEMQSYVKWSCVSDGEDYLVYEGWYVGTSTNGTFTYRRDNATDVYTQESTFETFNSNIETMATQMGFTANNLPILLPSNIDTLKTATPTISGELTKSGDIYSLVSSSSSFVYENNILTSIDGVGITFNQAIIPNIPQATTQN